MKNKKLLLEVAHVRMRAGMMMDWFEIAQDWKNYFKCCCMFRAYDEMLEKLKKEMK
jgi:hypothetical protein